MNGCHVDKWVKLYPAFDLVSRGVCVGDDRNFSTLSPHAVARVKSKPLEGTNQGSSLAGTRASEKKEAGELFRVQAFLNLYISITRCRNNAQG